MRMTRATGLALLALLASACASSGSGPTTRTPLESELQGWTRGRSAVTRVPLASALQPGGGGLIEVLVTGAAVFTTLDLHDRLSYALVTRDGSAQEMGYRFPSAIIPVGTTVGVMSFKVEPSWVRFQLRVGPWGSPESSNAAFIRVQVPANHGELTAVAVLERVSQLLDFDTSLDAESSALRIREAAEASVRRARARYTEVPPHTIEAVDRGYALHAALGQLEAAQRSYADLFGVAPDTTTVAAERAKLGAELADREQLIDREAAIALHERLDELWNTLLRTEQMLEEPSSNPVRSFRERGRDLLRVLREFIAVHDRYRAVGGAVRSELAKVETILAPLTLKLEWAELLDERGCRERPPTAEMLRDLVDVMPDSGLAELVRACGVAFEVTPVIISNLGGLASNPETRQALETADHVAWPQIPRAQDGP